MDRRLGRAERAVLIQLAHYAEYMPCDACPEAETCPVHHGGPGGCPVNRWIGAARRLAGVPIGDLD